MNMRLVSIVFPVGSNCLATKGVSGGEGSMYLILSQLWPAPPGFPVSMNQVSAPVFDLKQARSLSKGIGEGKLPASSMHIHEYS